MREPTWIVYNCLAWHEREEKKTLRFQTAAHQPRIHLREAEQGSFFLYCFILKVYLILFEADLQPLWRPVSTRYIYAQERKLDSSDELKPKAWLGVNTAIWGEECVLSVKSQSQKHSLRGLFNQLMFCILLERRAAPRKDVLKPKHSDIWLNITAIRDDLDLKKQINCLN